MGAHGRWKTVRSDWRDVVLVCRKCSKKLDGGFGPKGDEALGRSLRRALDDGAGRKAKPLRRAVAVVEVGCLGICPRKAVAVVRAGEPRSVVLVPKGAGMGEIAERLGLDTGRPDDRPAAGPAA